MTWHNTSHYIASNDVTITWPDPATDIKTSKHFTSKHKTSPPWNGRRLVHSKEMIWASRWSVALRTFYRQILSVLCSSFPFGNFRPRLVRALLVNMSTNENIWINVNAHEPCECIEAHRTQMNTLKYIWMHTTYEYLWKQTNACMNAWDPYWWIDSVYSWWCLQSNWLQINKRFLHD